MASSDTLPGFTGDDVQACIAKRLPVVKAVGLSAAAARSCVFDREMSGGRSRRCRTVRGGQFRLDELLAGPEPVRVVVAVGSAEIELPKIGAFTNLMVWQCGAGDRDGWISFHGQRVCWSELRARAQPLRD